MGEDPVAHAITWSTDAFPAAERVQAWTEVARGVFGPLRVRYDGDQAFGVTLRTVNLGPVGLAEIGGSGHRLVRQSADVLEGRVVAVNIQLAGWSRTSGRRRSLHTAAGRVAMISSPWPAMIELPDDFHQFLITIPSDVLEPLLLDPEASYGTVVENEGAAALIVHRAGYLIDHGGALDDDAARLVGYQLIDLIALGFNAGHSGTPVRRGDALAQRVLDEIERRLGDPALTAGVVAAELNISVRYLQQLLARRGTTFRRWVNLRRIERCQRAFDHDLGGLRSVSAIALENGFTDPARFAKLFRAHVGVSAREYRRGRAVVAPAD